MRHPPDGNGPNQDNQAFGSSHSQAWHGIGHALTSFLKRKKPSALSGLVPELPSALLRGLDVCRRYDVAMEFSAVVFVTSIILLPTRLVNPSIHADRPREGDTPSCRVQFTATARRAPGWPVSEACMQPQLCSRWLEGRT